MMHWECAVLATGQPGKSFQLPICFFFFPKELITELAKNLYGSPHKIRYHSLVVACLSMNLLQCYPLPGLVGRMLGTLSSLIPVPPGEGFSSHKGRVYLDFLSL